MTNHHHDDHPPSAERPLSRTTIRVVIAGGAYAGALILAVQAHRISWPEGVGAYLGVMALVAWFAIGDLRGGEGSKR